MTSAPYAVASLRLPEQAPFALTLPSPRPVSAWVARSVTLVRIPLAAAGVFALLQGEELAAIAAFVLFAVIDLFDGVAARRAGCDTAARRAGDVLLDRISIHVAAMVICSLTGVGWIPWLCLLSRDFVQATMSSRLAMRTHTVIIGAHWHMAYGLSMLLWGSVFIAVGYPPLWLTILTGAISAVTFIDYARRCARLERTFLSGVQNSQSSRIGAAGSGAK
jgi:phosphatidylglycerophosphate synthase